MQYRQFADWKVSEIGYGCYGLSGAYGSVDKGTFKKTIQEAYEAGVNFFDTAEGYGQAETFLGETVAPFRDHIYIATKLSGKSGSPDLSYRAVQEACEASLKRLNVDVIDLYQIHFDDPETPVEETVIALTALVDAGKIRRYGVCHLPLDKVVAYAKAGGLFSILMELSPVARNSLKTLLPVCEQYDLAAFAFSVTGRGILSGRYSAEHEFEPDDIRRMDPLFKRERFASGVRIQEFLAEMGRQSGCTAVQMGIAWVLSQPKIISALTGTSSPRHLAENLAASEVELTKQDLDAINSFLAQEDQRLAQAEQKTIQRLLTQPLADDAEASFNDLIYVMETAILNDLVVEEEVVPSFKALFGLRNSLDTDAKQKMVEIQAFLRAIIFSK